MKAIWNGKIIAESNKTINVENNEYFPLESINPDFLYKSDNKSTCPWKGQASYYNIIVCGKVNTDAAWYYPEPKQMAKQIKNHVAFWKGIEIIK